MSSPQDPQDPFSAPSDDERAGGFGWGQGPSGEDRAQHPYGAPPPQGAPAPYGAPPSYGAPGQGGPQGYEAYQGQGGYGGYGAAPDHPRATTAMVLGIGGLVGAFLCLLPIVLSPFAMVMGRRVVKEIDASQGRQGGRGQAQAGFVLGVIGTVLLALGVIGIVLFGVLVATLGFA